MSYLTAEQLGDLTALINARLEEFEAGLRRLPPGLVRVAHDEIKRWYEEREASWAMQRISDVTLAATAMMEVREQGYNHGYAEAKAELSPVRDEAEDKRARETADAFEMGLEAGCKERGNGYELAPQIGTGGKTHAPFSVVAVVDDPARYTANSALSPSVVATLGPEHTLVTPLVPRRQPRTLAEVYADEDGGDIEYVTTRQDVSATSSTSRISPDEKAAQLRACIAALQDMSDGVIMPSMTEWDKGKPAHLPKSDALTHRYDLSWKTLAGYARLEMGKAGRKAGAGPADPT